MHDTFEKHRLGNMTSVNVVIIGLPLHVLSASTAGVVIGKERLERNELSRIRNLPNLKLWIASDMTSIDKFTSEVSHLKREK